MLIIFVFSKPTSILELKPT